MVERWRLRAAPLVLLVAGLSACATTAAVAPPAPALAPGAVPATVVPPDAVRVLQLNLCSSGIAGCFTGRATAEAAALLRAEAPDLVTLNEVCADDVEVLDRALAEGVPGGGVTSAFQPARDATTGEPYRCRNGEQYGIGLVSRWPATADGGIHPAQDAADPEQRVWLCLDPAAPLPAVCTSHLAYTRRDVAQAQCRHLFGEVVAARRAPVVVGGDLNLGAADGPDLRSCLPVGSGAVDDGGPQVVAVTPGLAVADVQTLDLRGATDHPALLVTLGAGPA